MAIAIDVGGTKLKAGTLAMTPDGLRLRPETSREVPTPRLAPETFYDALAAVVHELRADSERRGLSVAPIIGMAHPGRFLSDGSLARGTTPNLGTAPGQFDGIKPADELGRRVGATVIAENDAVAQMRFGLSVLMNDPSVRPRLLGHPVVYLGPGTGMGGGVARVGQDGAVTVITDGHFFDLQVPGYRDGTWTAEEIFTGPAIVRLVTEANRRLAVPITPAKGGRLSEILDDPHAPAAHRDEALRLADVVGDILALLIEAIHQGRIVKVRVDTSPDGRLTRHLDEPDRAWPAADREAVRGTTRFILGGWLGTDRPLGGRVCRRALTVLAQRGLPQIEIIQIPIQSADAGLLGAATALPADQLRRAALLCAA